MQELLASELITQLQGMIDKYGDCSVNVKGDNVDAELVDDTLDEKGDIVDDVVVKIDFPVTALKMVGIYTGQRHFVIVAI